MNIQKKITLVSGAVLKPEKVAIAFKYVQVLDYPGNVFIKVPGIQDETPLYQGLTLPLNQLCISESFETRGDVSGKCTLVFADREEDTIKGLIGFKPSIVPSGPGGMVDPGNAVVPFRTTRWDLNLFAAPGNEIRSDDVAVGPGYTVNFDKADLTVVSFDVVDADIANPWTGTLQIFAQYASGVFPARLYDSEMRYIGQDITANGHYFMRGTGLQILQIQHLAGGTFSARVTIIGSHGWAGRFDELFNEPETIALDPVTGIQTFDARRKPVESLFLEIGGVFAGGETLTLAGSVDNTTFYFLAVYLAIGTYTMTNIKQFNYFTLTTSIPPSGITGSVEAVR